MNQSEIDSLLKETLTDSRLSQSEKKGLIEWLTAHVGDEHQRAFALSRTELGEHPEAIAVLGWLEDVLKLVNRSAPGESPKAAFEESQAFFSPGGGPLREIQQQFSLAKQSADMCVFTITDDRITSAILTAHKRGVKLRIITDNEKAHDAGSDIERLAASGVAVRVDRTPFHMHHKYALFDGRTLV